MRILRMEELQQGTCFARCLPSLAALLRYWLEVPARGLSLSGGSTDEGAFPRSSHDTGHLSLAVHPADRTWTLLALCSPLWIP